MTEAKVEEVRVGIIHTLFELLALVEVVEEILILERIELIDNISYLLRRLCLNVLYFIIMNIQHLRSITRLVKGIVV